MIWILGFFELIADVGISQYTRETPAQKIELKSEKPKKIKSWNKFRLLFIPFISKSTKFTRAHISGCLCRSARGLPARAVEIKRWLQGPKKRFLKFRFYMLQIQASRVEPSEYEKDNLKKMKAAVPLPGTLHGRRKRKRLSGPNPLSVLAKKSKGTEKAKSGEKAKVNVCVKMLESNAPINL